MVSHQGLESESSHIERVNIRKVYVQGFGTLSYIMPARTFLATNHQNVMPTNPQITIKSRITLRIWCVETQMEVYIQQRC